MCDQGLDKGEAEEPKKALSFGLHDFATCCTLDSKCFCDHLGLEVVFPSFSLLPPESEVAIHMDLTGQRPHHVCFSPWSAPWHRAHGPERLRRPVAGMESQASVQLRLLLGPA